MRRRSSILAQVLGITLFFGGGAWTQLASGQDLFLDEFEAGASLWTLANSSVTVGWAGDGDIGSTEPAPDGPAIGVGSLNYNNSNPINPTYDDGAQNSGTATSPLIDISAETTATFTFWCNYKTEDSSGTENAFDVRFIIISDSMGNPLLTRQYLTPDGPAPGGADEEFCSTSGTFHQHTVDLTPFISSGSITITFSFDTIDNVSNSFYGWAIDIVNVFGVLGGSGGSGGSGGGGSGGGGGRGGRGGPFSCSVTGAARSNRLAPIALSLVALLLTVFSWRRLRA